MWSTLPADTDSHSQASLQTSGSHILLSQRPRAPLWHNRAWAAVVHQSLTRGRLSCTSALTSSACSDSPAAVGLLCLYCSQSSLHFPKHCPFVFCKCNPCVCLVMYTHVEFGLIGLHNLLSLPEGNKMEKGDKLKATPPPPSPSPLIQ